MATDMDISMDIQAKSVDMDMDMDGRFHIQGNPGFFPALYSTVSALHGENGCSDDGVAALSCSDVCLSDLIADC